MVELSTKNSRVYFQAQLVIFLAVAILIAGVAFCGMNLASWSQKQAIREVLKEEGLIDSP